LKGDACIAHHHAVLRCEECRREAADFVAGWSAFYVSDPEADGSDKALVVYCSSCLTREFGGLLRWLQRTGAARARSRP
jgi:hypothetical protein